MQAGGAATNPPILELQLFIFVQTAISHQIWPAWAAEVLEIQTFWVQPYISHQIWAAWAAETQARASTARAGSCLLPCYANLWAANHMPGTPNSPDLKKKHCLLPRSSAACLTPPGILRIPGSVRHAEVAHYLTAHDATSMPHSPENPPDSRRRGAC